MDEAAIERCETAWVAKDHDALTKHARALGLALSAKVAAQLAALVSKHNGARRKHVMSLGDLLRTVEEARASPEEVATRHGGTERAAAGKTTMCLVVKHPKKDGVVVGVGSTFADRPSPGRVWKALGPWQQAMARNVEKAQAWALEAADDRVLVPFIAREGRAIAKDDRSSTRLLADVLARPDDDRPRLVYADWLTQQGDPRGEFIVVQCALESARAIGKRALVAREKVLLRAHRARWTREVSQVAPECSLRRGFVASIKTTANAFLAHGAPLFDREPIEELVVSKPNAPALRALAGAKHVARLRSLRFSSPLYASRPVDVEALRAFFTSPYVGAVNAIDLTIVVDGADLGDAFASIRWPNVKTLVARVIGAPAAIESLSGARLPALAKLVVPGASPPRRAALKKAFSRAEVVVR